MVVKNIRNHIERKVYNGLYLVVYGCEYHGEALNKEDLIKQYRRILKRAYNQDVYIYFNGNKIRGLYNLDKKLLDKTTEITCEYKKY